jgi:hypothetical protein
MPSIDRHPPPETLVAYHEKRLSDPEAEDVRAHLAACRDCTAELLGLADLLDGDGASAAEEISREDLDAAWQKQQQRLPAVAPVVPLEERRAGTIAQRWSWATAASLALAATLALVVVAQWRTIERLRQPQINPPLVNLEPADSVRAGSQEATELLFPEGTERALVILNPAEDLGTSAYDVVILAATDGETVLGFENRRSTEAGTFRLEVPRAALKPGDYRILLFKAGQHRTVEEFRLKVRHLL